MIEERISGPYSHANIPKGLLNVWGENSHVQVGFGSLIIVSSVWKPLVLLWRTLDN